ncbi:MAG: VCBS domain-containing protein [Fibromonadaceae bacterium]|jgi:VCBS repeat-containing protein|nr:VCBS domain-containing protein [Fibromonadaceae bacterium]
MKIFRDFKIWAAVLLVTAASWAQLDQTFNMESLQSQIDAFNAGNANMTITIGANFDITSPLEVSNNGYVLTIQSLTAEPRRLTRAVTGYLFTIERGSLTLQNIIIDGNNASSAYSTDAHGSLVLIDDYGTLNIHDGTTLQNNAIRNDNGSGVYVRGVFNMTDGTIKGNRTNLSGGGVYIYARRATFNMSGGLITENSCGTSATSYSGGVHFANTAFVTDDNPNTTPSVFRLGGTAVIKDNTKTNGSPSNVYMAGNRYITLGDGTDGVPPPTDGMQVWITKVAENGVFVNKGAKPPNPPDDPFGDAKYFQADAGSQVYYLEIGRLAMVAGYDISLSPAYLKLMGISDHYDIQPQEITVTNTGGHIGKLTISVSGEHASNFELDLTNISDLGMTQNASQTFTIKPKSGLKAGIYSAFVLVSAPADIDGGPVVMRRLDVEFMVREYIEDRTLYFNQSDGKFYASNEYTEIGLLPAPDIFTPDNVVNIPASWNSETNALKIYGVNWTTTAPYALYFSQPTPITLELFGDNSFVSNITDNSQNHSAGIVSRSSLTIIGDGSLEAKGGSGASTESFGIFSLALTINSGTLIASGETTAMEIEKDIILRTPASQYEWWHTDETTKGSGEFIYDPDYKWVKIKVPQPIYALEASVDINEPLIGTEIEVTLTVKDITSGEIHDFNENHPVVLTGVQLGDFGITASDLAVQFHNGIGKINLRPQNPGKQILWFSMENPDYPAINPIVITPISVSTPAPSISLSPSILTFPSAIYGYFAQASLNFIVENTGERPTGELTIKLSGNDSTSFAISSNKVATIAAGGSAVFQIAPILGLNAKAYTTTIIVSGSDIEESKELTVSFAVEKASGAEISAPSLASKTANSIFINAIPRPGTGQEIEYAISKTNSAEALEFVTFSTVLSILEFSDLTPNTTYYIFARAKENANYYAGAISEPLESYVSEPSENCVPFNEIAVALWGNNTLTVINNPVNNSVNSTFSNFIWFRDGQEIGSGQSWSEYEDGRQLPPGKYHVEMPAENDKLIISCEYEVPEPNIAGKISVIDFSDVETVDVYSVSGKHLARLNAQGSFPAEIRSIKNAYVLVLKNKTGAKKTIRAMEVLK